MDPKSSIGRLCLDEGNALSDKDLVESEGNWNGTDTWDTTDSGKKEEVKAFTFFRMEKEDGTWDRYITPCYVEGVNVFDGVTDLDLNKNLISQELVVQRNLKFTVLENGDKKVDKKLLVNLVGEIFVLEFYVNPEEDDVEPSVILGRPFLRLAKAIVNLQLGIITLWPEPPVFDSDDEELDALLANFSVEELPPIIPNPADFPNYVCNMGKGSRNKNKPHKTYKMTYDQEGFEIYFQKSLRDERDFNEIEYWSRISTEEELRLSRSATNTIRSPVLKVLHKMISYGLCQRTTGYDKIQKHELWLLSMFEDMNRENYANVAWVIARWMKKKGKGTQDGSKIICGQFVTKIAKRMKFLTENILSTYSTPTPCRSLTETTLRELIGDDGKLLSEDPTLGVLRLVQPIPPSPILQEIYQRLGLIERNQAAMERIVRRNAYHWERYAPLFDSLAAQQGITLSTYAPPGSTNHQPSTSTSQSPAPESQAAATSPQQQQQQS